MAALGPEILGVAEHAMLDQLAVHSGISIETLMENAGRQVANEIAKRWPAQRTFVLCGPGNNGGDGYVVARHLRARGYDVTVLTIGDHVRMDGAAKAMRDAWTGPKEAWQATATMKRALYVDAIYGAGLNRAIPEGLAAYFDQIRDSDSIVAAVDVPSGLHGDTAAPLGPTVWADLTVTFFRHKPAHVLMPGRKICGETVVVDIGIPQGLVIALAEAQAEGALPQALFSEINPKPIIPLVPEPDTHKFERGHAVVIAGPALATGAARLAARAALRIGAGLVTLAAGDPDAALACAHHVTAEMVASFSGEEGLRALLTDPRKNVVVVGPGLGLTPNAQDIVTTVLAGHASVVLDADAITAFQAAPDKLFDLIKAKPKRGVVITPHEGEFERLFPGLRKRAVNKIEAARMAADRSGAVIVLKGADTVIAAPDGRSRVNMNAPHWLATAGSGDVLAGIVGGLLGQRFITPYEAASAAVWLHGAAGAVAGPGLIATDLAEVLPKVLKNLGSDPKIAL